MKANRREFLGGLLAITGAVSVGGVSLADIPKLYGDGINDDGPALTALLAGNPVDADGAIAVRDGGTVYLKADHIYRVRETVVIDDNNRHLDGNGATLKALPGTHEVLRFTPKAQECSLSNIHVIGGETGVTFDTWYDTT